jgi:biotin carboxylase
MPTCLLTNPILNNILAEGFVAKGIECCALIDIKSIAEMSSSYRGRESGFNQLLYSRIFVDIGELPAPSKKPFDAIIAGSEVGVKDAEILAKRYGLSGNDPATTELRRDKYAMQIKLRKCGLSSIKSMIISRGASQREIRDELGAGPLIFKPTGAAGCEGFVKCDNDADLDLTLSQLPWGKINCGWQKNENFVVQQFVKGTEYVVDLVAQKGVVKVSAVCRYVRDSEVRSDGLTQIKRMVIALDPDDSKLKRLLSYAVNAAQCLGIRQGAAHMELFDTGSNIVMIEVGARIHGTEMPILLANVYEPDLLTSFYNSYFHERTPIVTARLKKHAVQIYGFKTINSRVSLDWKNILTNIKKLESYVFHSVNETAIEVPQATTNLGDAPVFGYFANENLQVLADDVAEFDNIAKQAVGLSCIGRDKIRKFLEHPIP